MRQYFDKIKDAEDPAKRPYLRSLTTHPVSHFINILDDDHHTGQLAIDKVAASRFIKHAIAQAKDTRPITVSSPTTHIPSNDNDNDNGDSGAAATARDVRLPVKMTEKMLEREKYHEALREEAQASDDGGDLEVFDGEDEPSDEAGRTPPPEEDASSHAPLQATSSELDVTGKQKGKGKAKAVAGGTPIHDVPPPSETAAGKRRRPPVDPFAGLCLFFCCPQVLVISTSPSFLLAGYGDSQDTAAPADAGFMTNTSRSGAKVRRIHKQDFSAEASSGTNTPSVAEHQDQAKRSKKRFKKKVAL